MSRLVVVGGIPHLRLGESFDVEPMQRDETLSALKEVFCFEGIAVSKDEDGNWVPFER